MQKYAEKNIKNFRDHNRDYHLCRLNDTRNTPCDIVVLIRFNNGDK